VRPLLILFTLCFLGCSGIPKRGPHFTAPSAEPVRAHIASAQAKAKTAKEAVEQNRPDEAKRDIDALSDELLNVQTALRDYELKSIQQTATLNACEDDKNTALTLVDKEKQKASRASGKLWRTRFLLLAAVIWIFRTPLLALLKMAVGLIAKIP
jgi:hypothetical protein